MRQPNLIFFDSAYCNLAKNTARTREYRAISDHVVSNVIEESFFFSEIDIHESL